jgi:hypothetical protein
MSMNVQRFDRKGGISLKPEELAEKFASALREKAHLFSELLEANPDVPYRSFLQGWSELRTRYDLKRDAEGRYLLK